MRAAQKLGQVRRARLLHGRRGVVSFASRLQRARVLVRLLLLGLLVGGRLCGLEQADGEVPAGSEQKHEQHHDHDEDATHTARFAHVGGDFLLCSRRVTPSRGSGVGGNVGVERRGLDHGLEALERIGVFVLVVAFVAEAARVCPLRRAARFVCGIGIIRVKRGARIGGAVLCVPRIGCVGVVARNRGKAVRPPWLIVREGVFLEGYLALLAGIGVPAPFRPAVIAYGRERLGQSDVVRAIDLALAHRLIVSAFCCFSSVFRHCDTFQSLRRSQALLAHERHVVHDECDDPYEGHRDDALLHAGHLGVLEVRKRRLLVTLASRGGRLASRLVGFRGTLGSRSGNSLGGSGTCRSAIGEAFPTVNHGRLVRRARCRLVSCGLRCGLTFPIAAKTGGARFDHNIVLVVGRNADMREFLGVSSHGLILSVVFARL